ncbi:hypothetical protein VTP01DRAFT_9824 [Rhizomucor pusillus]|uniref:uncharacterized protein n=1 Tax=Rhizomucor pusillus TaxID=4840 RepID=UPI0037426F0B
MPAKKLSVRNHIAPRESSHTTGFNTFSRRSSAVFESLYMDYVRNRIAFLEVTSEASTYVEEDNQNDANLATPVFNKRS